MRPAQRKGLWSRGMTQCGVAWLLHTAHSLAAAAGKHCWGGAAAAALVRQGGRRRVIAAMRVS